MGKQKNLTKFQVAVLGAIKKIPRGKVTTYKAVARKVGRPKASRAVGNALHINPWAPKVPCHRIVKSDGGIGGYGGGVAKKITLLKKEGVKIKNEKVSEFNQKFIRL